MHCFCNRHKPSTVSVNKDTLNFSPYIGIRAWDVDLTVCNLDEQLKLFTSQHSSYESKDIRGLISAF